MPKNPPDKYPRITPSFAYKDANAAIEWLEKAFGFQTRMKIPGPGGVIVHAELEVQDSLIMLGPSQACHEHFVSPQETGGKVTQGTYIYVDDVDAHFENAKAAGAKILSEPEDMFYGDRKYEVFDLEGHLWTFTQHVRDVSDEEMMAALEQMDESS